MRKSSVQITFHLAGELFKFVSSQEQHVFSGKIVENYISLL